MNHRVGEQPLAHVLHLLPYSLCIVPFHLQLMQHEKFRKGDVRHCFADNSKLRNLLGFSPKIPFEEGIRVLIEWSQAVEAVDHFEKARAELEAKGLA